MDYKELQEFIFELIKEYTNDLCVTDETCVCLDSIDTLSLIMDIETKYNFVFPDEDMDKFDNCQAKVFVDYVWNKLNNI